MVTCCSKYKATDLNEPVTFERVTQTPDGAGGFTEAWATISGAPTRAMVKPMSGREVWASMRVEARSTVMVVTRYFAGLKEGDRVVIGGENHNIRYIRDVDLAKRWLEINAEGGVAS